MSSYTGTIAETLYASVVAGISNNTFTTETTMYAATQPACVIPAGFFDPTYGIVGKTLRITARGIWGTTTVAPTFTVGFRLNSTNAVGGIILATAHALTAYAVSATSQVWEVEFDVTSSSGSSASAHNEVNLMSFGQCAGIVASNSTTTLNGSVSNGSAIGTLTPGTAVLLTTSDAAQYLVPTVTCGTSNAANTFQMLQLIVQGLN